MNDEPLTLLRRMYTEHAPIRLLNVYKGLPISNEANITAIDGGTISVSSIRSQIVCMYLDRETYIQSAAQPAIIKASVLEFDVSRNEARLGNFQYARGRIGERRQVRVVPVDPINGLVQPKNLGGTVNAELADISHTGLAIYLPRRVFVPDIFKVGAELVVNLTLPVTMNNLSNQLFNSPQSTDPMARFDRENLRGFSGMLASGEINRDEKKERQKSSANKKILIRAEIKNLKVEMPRDRVRVGMRMIVNAEAQSIISAFISQRQAELVREVKALYDLLNRFDN